MTPKKWREPMPSMKINDIQIGKRYRKNATRIEELADSMAIHGLMQPVGINTKNELVFGAKRIYAAMRLGWQEIECKVFDVEVGSLEAKVMEYSENKDREGWTDSEKVTILKDLRDTFGER